MGEILSFFWGLKRELLGISRNAPYIMVFYQKPNASYRSIKERSEYIITLQKWSCFPRKRKMVVLMCSWSLRWKLKREDCQLSVMLPAHFLQKATTSDEGFVRCAGIKNKGKTNCAWIGLSEQWKLWKGETRERSWDLRSDGSQKYRTTRVMNSS